MIDPANQIIQRKPGILALKGDITIVQVPTLAQAGLALISQQVGSHCQIDWSQVQNVDSSALALAIHWLRQTKIQKKHLKYQHIPEAMRKLSEICGVKKLIFSQNYDVS